MKTLLRSSILALMVVGTVAGIATKNSSTAATIPGKPPCALCANVK